VFCEGGGFGCGLVVELGGEVLDVVVLLVEVGLG
jgi:hypothetical protein